MKTQVSPCVIFCVLLSSSIRYGIALGFDHDALRKVAKLASGQGTGARGLLTVLDDVLREFKFELPGRRLIRSQQQHDGHNDENGSSSGGGGDNGSGSGGGGDCGGVHSGGGDDGSALKTVLTGGGVRLWVDAATVDDPDRALEALLKLTTCDNDDDDRGEGHSCRSNNRAE